MESKISLHVKSPTGVSRMFSPNTYRATYPVFAPSILYGFLCNLAGIEMRLKNPTYDNVSMCDDLPNIGIKVAYKTLPIPYELFQHTLKTVKNTKTLKLNNVHQQSVRQSIRPMKSGYLYGIDMWIELTASNEIIRRIRNALNGIIDPLMNTGGYRYGHLFLGDSTCLVSYIAEKSIPNDDMYWMKWMNADTRKIQAKGFNMPIWVNRMYPNLTRYGQFSIVHGTYDIADQITVGPKENVHENV